MSGLLLPGERLILVNAEEAGRAPGRRRFTIAHGIGHWAMHWRRATGVPAYCRGTAVHESDHAEGQARASPYPPLEREANRFAAAVLMPREEVLGGAIPATVDEEYELARVFGVSRQAIVRRLSALHGGS